MFVFTRELLPNPDFTSERDFFSIKSISKQSCYSLVKLFSLKDLSSKESDSAANPAIYRVTEIFQYLPGSCRTSHSLISSPFVLNSAKIGEFAIWWVLAEKHCQTHRAKLLLRDCRNSAISKIEFLINSPGSLGLPDHVPDFSSATGCVIKSSSRRLTYQWVPVENMNFADGLDSPEFLMCAGSVCGLFGKEVKVHYCEMRFH